MRARRDRQPPAVRVLRLLRTPMTCQQLRARLGADPSPMLRRLVREGQVEAIENTTDALTHARVYRRRETHTRTS